MAACRPLDPTLAMGPRGAPLPPPKRCLPPARSSLPQQPGWRHLAPHTITPTCDRLVADPDSPTSRLLERAARRSLAASARSTPEKVRVPAAGCHGLDTPVKSHVELNGLLLLCCRHQTSLH